MRARRWWFVALGVVALSLTVLGLVLAATDPNPSELPKDPLVLNGYPPKTADLLLTVSAGASFGVSANVDVNFVSGRGDAVVQLPLAIASVAVDARLVDDHLYLRSADVSDGPWYGLRVGSLPLFGISLELTKPDIDLITGFTSKTVTKSGYSTTYTFYRDHVAVTNLFAPSTTQSRVGSVTWTITTGSQGEVSASTLLVKTRGSRTYFTATVESYNRPVKVSSPASKDVKALKESTIEKILASASLKKLYIPTELTSLGRSSLT